MAALKAHEYRKHQWWLGESGGLLGGLILEVFRQSLYSAIAKQSQKLSKFWYIAKQSVKLMCGETLQLGSF